MMENQMCRYIFDRDEFEKAAHFTAERLLNDNAWRQQIYKKIQYFTDNYFAAGEKLRKSDLSKLTASQIIKLVQKIIYFQHYHQVYSVLANGVVLDGRNHLSNKIREELSQHLGNPANFESYWALLTQVTKMSLRQEKDYKMAKLARSFKFWSRQRIYKELKKLHENYCWLDYNNMGPASSLEQFERELKEASHHVKLKAELLKTKNKQVNLMKKLKFDTRSKFLVFLAQNVIWQKGFRKDMQYHGFYCYESLLKELAIRKKVKDWQILSFMFPWEVEGYIKTSKPNTTELESRRKFSIFTVSRKEGRRILQGSKARLLWKKLGSLEDYGNIAELKWQPAYAGLVRGRVKIVQIPKDMAKMNKGDILISQATSPDLLPAMKKAGAIVTNTGGLICHAAITSRELKIPCIVGTAKATMVFKDGDMVEVDANRGIVRLVEMKTRRVKKIVNY